MTGTRLLPPTNGDPDLMASVFNSVISSLLEVHAPLKRRKIKSHHAPWITVEIKNLMKLAKKRSEKDASYWSEYKSLQNKVTSELARNTNITLLMKPKTIRKLCGKQ